MRGSAKGRMGVGAPVAVRASFGTWLMAVLLVFVPGSGEAQAPDTVVTEGQSDVALDRRLARLLAADPLILTSDTRIREGDTIAGSVLLLDATLIHEGTILGDLVIVDAGAFIRHQAVVGGDLVNMGGGLYRSARARIGGHVIDLPDASYRVVRGADRIVIEAADSPARLRPDGLLGVHAPTYDRVNGLTLAWGAAYRLPRFGNVTPTLRGHAGWRTELGEPVYGSSLGVRFGANTLEGGYRNGSWTHDDWIIAGLRNSLNYVWDGDDFRNYYDADRIWVGLTRAIGDEAKSFHAEVRVEAGIENGRTLGGGDPWHLLGDSARVNPAIDDGRTASVEVGFDATWHGMETDLVVGGEYEAGRSWVGGEYTFDRVAGRARFAMHGIMDHTLEIRAYGQLPLGQDTLPRQRWSHVGGPETLQTEPIGENRGDRVLWVETRYRMPTPDALALPVLGAPELQLIHAAGMAWLADDDGALTQEVGARIQFFGPYIQYMFQPSDASRDDLVIGLAWPFAPGFPWQG